MQIYHKKEKNKTQLINILLTPTLLNHRIHTIPIVFNITDRRAAFADINRTAVYSNIPSFGATAGGKR